MESEKGSLHCFEQPIAATAWKKINPVSFRITSIVRQRYHWIWRL